MKPISIDFCDFWTGFPKAKNFFTEILRRRFDVRVCERPDFLICSNYGRNYRLHTCPRIFYTGESVHPDFSQFDYAMTFDYLDDPRHLRLPLYVLYATPDRLIHFSYEFTGPFPKQMDPPEEVLRRKTKFCAFVVGNTGRSTHRRNNFFRRLNEHKRVDSAGSALNNVGGPIPAGPANKLAFLQPYKFNICFENKFIPGYTTEKIYEAMRARCIPIYWGNPRIHEEFNPQSFLNYSDFPDQDALIQRILEIDRNDDLYLEYLRQPYFNNNVPNEYFSEERLLNFFERIFATPIRPVGHRRRFFQFRRWIPVKQYPKYLPAIWTASASPAGRGNLHDGPDSAASPPPH